MTQVPLSELDALARSLAGERHDAYSSRMLARAYEEYVARRRAPLGSATLVSDGADFPTFYALLQDPRAQPDTVELAVEGAPPAGPAWDFLAPVERVAFHVDGSADLFPPGATPPRRAISRVLLREHFLPRSRAEDERGAAGGARVASPGTIGPLGAALGAARSQGLIPFGVALLLYLPDGRVRYELDLVRSALLPDPRAGRLPVARRTPRSSRVSWGVDQTVGRGDLSLLSARCLEVLVESSGLSPVELAPVFGGVRELVDSALQGLVARGLATFDRRTGVYRPRLDAFVPAAEGPGETAAGPDPALHTSVQELIAAADARATCPLCGAPLPGGARGILCADCAAKVAAA